VPLLVSAATAFLVVPAVAGVPARLARGCGRWIAGAAALELLSSAGFVVVFKLVFAAPLSWGRTVPAAMRALGASTVLPGGGFIGPTLGAWSATPGKPSLSRLTRATTTFVILTSAPGAVVLSAVGILLWLGVASGPDGAPLTIVPALLASGLLAAAWVGGRFAQPRPAPRPARLAGALAVPARAIIDGISDARSLVTAGNWKLQGAVAYYAFDNAVLWAAFHAFGPSPRVTVIVMGYLVGSLAGALPVPAGLGALDGGLVGALVLYGSPAAPAAAAVLLYRGISLLLPVVLGALGLACSPVGDRVRRFGHPARRVVAPELVTAQADKS
jgi:uncharacterized membrane protein YbhN (UPF0104 family)